MANAAETRNLSEEAYDQIRRDILNGQLFPDEKLQIDAISIRYGIGVVPVREALNRLSSQSTPNQRPTITRIFLDGMYTHTGSPFLI